MQPNPNYLFWGTHTANYRAVLNAKAFVDHYNTGVSIELVLVKASVDHYNKLCKSSNSRRLSLIETKTL